MKVLLKFIYKYFGKIVSVIPKTFKLITNQNFKSYKLWITFYVHIYIIIKVFLKYFKQ